ncbi:adenylate/guanylate cyclase domain-containing protein [Bradyrhizobium sp. CB3481]|uniref:adenylate/guanylate cyclase domain-containing protein n=1 Tax=Bradyrhizobium sp. CB3481 TaxID=3039158 RepID=UPI0024B0B355|nr:adenylate/guanylate cyclase domain-containing protein [Bradyrhizobium sp. CB3481]WFU20255.1 adenylate/guanylate cyclase domain-containing protein [Bradyrhizobium sp. CB3481]
MDVAAWLCGLGLGQYEQAFRENDIDAEVLMDLTAEDLIGLGIASIGHRRKLLAAIAALRATSPATAASAAVSEKAWLAPEAERRQLTVMFVDLVDSTALAARLDPEEMADVLRTYQNAVAGAIARFEGHVAKYMGDGVLAYFGYPRAHEDEAERAMRAGLAAVAAVHSLGPAHGETLATRVGIATGPVVVGELIGEGAAREETVVGDTPNLAARLQTLAEPDTVVISARTRELVGGLFVLDELGLQILKGFPVPVRAWRVIGEGAAESRFEALHGAGLTPLVGRENEIGLLLEHWERAKEGEGQVLLLAGEPGIGKSRLVRALRGRLENEPHTPLSHYCSPHHQTSPLHPVIGLLERAAGFAADDAAATRLDKLESLLALSTDDVAGVAPLLAALLSLDTNARYPPLDMSPHRQKERTLEELVDQVLGLARRRPVLALYEDVHWADPTSLELLDLLVDRVQGASVLVLITFRPEFAPPWIRCAHVTMMTLNRLSRRQGAAMVARLSGGKALPPVVLDQIVAKTDGVPLFVEELTRTVLEANLLRDEGDHYALAGPLLSMAIPATLQESLLARLDRLAPAREVAQVGAAIGREFSHELLAMAAALPQSDLQAGLDDLVGSGLVFRRGTPPQVTYSFKHALVQDAAYATLVRAKRQRLHARIAAALEQHFPETVQAQPELLAHHFMEAGLAERAIDYWLRAGQAEIARSATAEAITQLSKGLELIPALTNDAARWRQELELQVALGVALMAAKGWAAPEVGRANARARDLCERLGDTSRFFPVLYGKWVFHVVRAELEAGRTAGEDLLHRAQEQNDAAAETVGNRIVGTAELLRGELGAARAHLERTLALYDPAAHRSLAFLFAQDPRVAGLSVLSWGLFALGYPEQAQAKIEQALTDAKELSHRNTLGYALLYGCILSQLRHDKDEARDRANALITLAAEQDAPHFLGAGIIIRGWTLGEAGDFGTGIAQIRDGLAMWQATGAGFLVPYFRSLLAEVHGRSGAVNEGLDLITEALDRAEETSEEWFEAELHRIMGELTLRLPKPDPIAAEAQFGQAAATARQQGAKLWELRAATSLARLWREQGRRGEAHDLLAPLYSQFTEGFGTPDLQAANAILRETTASSEPRMDPKCQ